MTGRRLRGPGLRARTDASPRYASEALPQADLGREHQAVLKLFGIRPLS